MATDLYRLSQAGPAGRILLPGAARRSDLSAFTASGIISRMSVESDQASSRYAIDIYDAVEVGATTPVLVGTNCNAVAPAAVKNVQHIWIPEGTGQNADGGTFYLSYGGIETAAIPYDPANRIALAADIDAALVAIVAIGAAGVTVTGLGTVASPWIVTFDKAPVGNMLPISGRSLLTSSKDPGKSFIVASRVAVVGSFVTGVWMETVTNITLDATNRRHAFSSWSAAGERLSVIDLKVQCSAGMIIVVTPPLGIAAADDIYVEYEPDRTGATRFRAESIAGLAY